MANHSQADVLEFIDAQATPQSPGSSTLVDSITVTAFDLTSVTFRQSGRDNTRDLSRIGRVWLDRYPALTQAQDLALAGDAAGAADAYFKLLRQLQRLSRMGQNITPQGLPAFVSARLFPLATKAGRYDASVAAYVVLLSSGADPARLKLPPPPQAGSAFLSPALADIDEALTRPDLPPIARTALKDLKARLPTSPTPASTPASTSASTPARTSPNGSSTPLATRPADEAILSRASELAQSGQHAQALNLLLGVTPPGHEEPQLRSTYFLLRAQSRKALSSTTGREQPNAQEQSLLAAADFVRSAGPSDTGQLSQTQAAALLEAAAILRSQNLTTDAAILAQEVIKLGPPDQAAKAQQLISR